MRALDIEKAIKSELAPAYVITGEDEYLKRYVREKLLSTIGEEDRTFSYVYIDYDSNKDVGEILDAANAFSFSQAKKMVEVSSFSFKIPAKDEKALDDYFKYPSPFSFILFMGSEKSLAIIKKYAEVIDCDKASEDELYNYINKMLKADDYKMQGLVVREFIRYCNYDFGKIVSEMTKLKLYTLDRKEITRQDIENLTPPDIETKAYALTNALTKGDFASAIDTLQTLKSRGVESNVLFGLLNNTYRRLYQLATTGSSDDTIMKVTGFSFGALRMNKDLVARNRKEIKGYVFKLKDAVDFLTDLEYRYKSSDLDVDAALDLAVAHILGQG